MAFGGAIPLNPIAMIRAGMRMRRVSIFDWASLNPQAGSGLYKE